MESNIIFGFYCLLNHSLEKISVKSELLKLKTQRRMSVQIFDNPCKVYILLHKTGKHALFLIWSRIDKILKRFT